MKKSVEEKLKEERIWVLEEIEFLLKTQFNMDINPQDGIRIINRISKRPEKIT